MIQMLLLVSGTGMVLSTLRVKKLTSFMSPNMTSKHR